MIGTTCHRSGVEGAVADSFHVIELPSAIVAFVAPMETKVVANVVEGCGFGKVSAQAPAQFITITALLSEVVAVWDAVYIFVPEDPPLLIVLQPGVCVVVL